MFRVQRTFLFKKTVFDYFFSQNHLQKIAAGINDICAVYHCGDQVMLNLKKISGKIGYISNKFVDKFVVPTNKLIPFDRWG